MDWKQNLITDEAGLKALLADTRSIAVLGIKTEAQSGQPAFYVASYLNSAGFDVIPVPVYYPDVKEILGKPVYRKVADIPQAVDMVNVFRRSEDVPPHVDDIIAKKPRFPSVTSLPSACSRALRRPIFLHTQKNSRE